MENKIEKNQNEFFEFSNLFKTDTSISLENLANLEKQPSSSSMNSEDEPVCKNKLLYEIFYLTYTIVSFSLICSLTTLLIMIILCYYTSFKMSLNFILTFALTFLIQIVLVVIGFIVCIYLMNDKNFIKIVLSYKNIYIIAIVLSVIDFCLFAAIVLITFLQ